MRLFIGAAVLVLVMILVGWITVWSDSGDGEPGARLETEKIKQDTAEIIESGKSTIEGMSDAVGSAVDSAGDEIREERAEDAAEEDIEEELEAQDRAAGDPTPEDVEVDVETEPEGAGVK